MRMTQLNVRLRPAYRLVAACALAAAAGGLVLTAAPAPVRLLGVSAQTSGRTAALLIEATEPVAYAVSRPDPLTLLVDLRNVNVGDAANQVARGGVISGVTLEQQTAIDGKSLARVRVALASPTSYRVRSARNTIRVELESTTAPVHEEGTPAAVKPAAVAPPATTAVSAGPTRDVEATIIEKVHAEHTKTATTVVLSGNGRLDPASLTESDDQPRRLVLDFPNVSSKAPAQTGVNSAFVKKVRVATSSSRAARHARRDGAVADRGVPRRASRSRRSGPRGRVRRPPLERGARRTADGSRHSGGHRKPISR